MSRIAIDDITRRHISFVEEALYEEKRRIDEDRKIMFSSDHHKLDRAEPLMNPQSRELYLLGKYKPETSSLLDMSRLPRPCLSQTQTAVDRQEPRLKQSSAPPRLLPSPSHRVVGVRERLNFDNDHLSLPPRSELPPIFINNSLRTTEHRYDYPPDRQLMHLIVFDRPFEGGQNTSLEHQRPLPRKLNSLRVFRISAMVVVFTIIMRKKDKIKELMVDFKQGRISDWHFALRIREFVLLIQKLYLDPKKKIYMTLTDLYTNETIDLYAAVSADSTRSQRNLAISNIKSLVENLIYDISSIQPEDGALLAINNKSFIYECTQSGRLFPPACLWQMERDLFQFDEDNRTMNVQAEQGFLLLVIFFLGKGFIRAIVMEPVRARLMVSAPTPGRVEQNFQMLATVLVRLLRQVLCTVDQRGQSILPEVKDVSRPLYSDVIMESLYVKLHQSFDYAEKLLVNWGQRYMDQLGTLSNTQ